MFDFDGTITDKGIWSPSQEMADALALLAQKMPIAFCTGRQLESFVRRGLTALIQEIKPEIRLPFMQNLFLFAENGTIGYEFDLQTEDFKEFYTAPWPTKFVVREYLQKVINEAVKEYGEVYFDAHKVVIVARTKLHAESDMDMDEVYRLSGEMAKICTKILKEIDPDFEKYLHVGDSGIGVIICPANGDKDRAIQEFATLLKVRRELEIGREAREILAVGDRPLLGGNDYFFLKGEYGTAYTVGDLTDDIWPKPVLNKNGRRLVHSQGTLCLIRSLLA